MFSFHEIGFIVSGAGAIGAQPPFRNGRCSLPCNRFGVGWGWRDLGAAAAHEWEVSPPSMESVLCGAELARCGRSRRL